MEAKNIDGNVHNSITLDSTLGVQQGYDVHCVHIDVQLYSGLGLSIHVRQVQVGVLPVLSSNLNPSGRMGGGGCTVVFSKKCFLSPPVTKSQIRSKCGGKEVWFFLVISTLNEIRFPSFSHPNVATFPNNNLERVSLQELA